MFFKFGKKQSKKSKTNKDKTDKKNSKAKKRKGNKNKNEPQRVSEKEKIFRDVRLYRVMPIVLLLSIFCLVGGFGWMAYNTHAYNVAQAKVSMKNGQSLPLYYDTSENQQKGTLKLGRSIISKNHKQMAVSIQYNATAHTNLSAFGNEYKIYFVCTPNYPVQNIHIKYGFFGTDGNGVLQITSDKPFKNEAFDIILVDKQDLVSSSDLNNGNSDSTTMNDQQLTKSITAELSDGTLASSGQDASTPNDGTKGKHLPASYYVRLNPYSSIQSKTNWGDNELALVDNLFVKHNLAKIQASINNEKSKIKQAKNTLAEFNHRLAVNPNDSYAQQQKEAIEDDLSGLESNLKQNETNFETIKKARLKKDILGEEANTFNILKTSNLNRVQPQGGDN